MMELSVVVTDHANLVLLLLVPVLAVSDVGTVAPGNMTPSFWPIP